MSDDENFVFLSYTSADRDRVEPLADTLIAAGIDAWIDVKRLKPGQDWDFEIRRALDKSALIVIFISEKSINKRGYVQKELRIALKKAEEKLIDDIYVIPVLLDEGVTLPDQISNLQFIRIWDDQFQEKFIDAVQHQLNKVGVALEIEQHDSEINWSYYTYREFRDGIPGYEAEFRFPRLYSMEFPLISQAADIVRGDLLGELACLRHGLLEPDTDSMNFGQDRFRRIHTLDAIPQTIKIHGRVISLSYWLHSYYAMSAHPNLGIRTYCFLVDPLCRINSLADIFTDADAAFNEIQSTVRAQLLSLKIDESEEALLEADWVETGTEEWANFSAFMFEEEGIEIHFPPYQVGPYAAGPQSVLIDYKLLGQNIAQTFRSALEIEYLAL